MNPARARFARLAALLSALLIVVASAGGCGSRSRELQPGSYRAVLELPGGELPFGLDVAQEESGPVLYLVNGEERVRVTEVTVTEGRLTAHMPGYENTLGAEIRGGKLQGELSLLRPGGERQVLPFRAEVGQAWRFFEEPATDNADIAGRWAVTFTSDAGKKSPGVAEFAQSFERVTGTILTPTGDHRFLAGEVRGDELYLSRFDGASAYLYRARVDERGDLAGEYWSGKTGHQKFRAERNPDAVLDMSGVATGMRNPSVKLEFTFPDLDDRPVSLTDPRFQGKVVIVTLTGSWCPNCHDEAVFLAQLYRDLRGQGLEVVSLMFEHYGDFAQAAAATRRFRDDLGIEYTTLIAGTSDRDEAAKALPQLAGVFAFPTTIWVDRSGTVRKIHAGFSGPATGAHYAELTREFKEFTLGLLAEAAGAPAAGTSPSPAATASVGVASQ
jgi:thiol-disulfide isomerase/thioredoxin